LLCSYFQSDAGGKEESKQEGEAARRLFHGRAVYGKDERGGRFAGVSCVAGERRIL
jgi:hypothetical protein